MDSRDNANWKAHFNVALVVIYVLFFLAISIEYVLLEVLPNVTN